MVRSDDPDETAATRIARYADVLERLCRVRYALPGTELPESSPARAFARTEQAVWGDSAITDELVVVVDLWTLVAADQVAGLAALIQTSHVFALFPLLRSSIEHSCAAVWVLDPQIRPEQRFARAAAAVLRGRSEAVTAAAHLGGRGNATHREQRERLRQTRERIMARFPNDTNLDRAIVAGEPLPRPTEILRLFGERWGHPGEFVGIYDYLCATANHPGVLAFEYVATRARGLELHVPLDLLDRLLGTAVVPLVKALEHYVEYCSWPRDELDTAIEAMDGVFAQSPLR